MGLDRTTRFRARGLEYQFTSEALSYSYFRDSTGSICAARFAGRVPKMTPTAVEVTSAITTDHGETGRLYEVKKRTESGRGRPRMAPTMPPPRGKKNASMRNCS